MKLSIRGRVVPQEAQKGCKELIAHSGMGGGITVLSLFDGISVGRVALERAGITIREYYKAEVDVHATRVAKSNYPDDINLGNVENWKNWRLDWAGIDLLIGGSPCQGFSFAGKQLAFDDPRSKLFFVYLDILNHIRQHNPDVKFLLENVKMKSEYLRVIDKALGTRGIEINSASVSAQNRVRFYWCNWRFCPPKHRGITLKDIQQTPYLDLENESIMKNGKTYCLTANYAEGPWAKHSCTKKVRSMVVTGITTDTDVLTSYNGKKYRPMTPEECELLQTLPVGYTRVVSTAHRYKVLGNSWTADIITVIFQHLRF